jgi:hypothetical protein
VSAKQIVRWTWLPVLLVFVYSGWVLYSRRTDNARIAEEAERKRIVAEGEVVEKLGGGNLKMLMFYANPPIIKSGEKTLLCYGVAGAKSVRIEPNVDGVGPSLSRCVEASPKQTTTYTLIAADTAGVEQKSEIEVRVQ